jgi:3-hydroxyisobutyrate dehydrogenase-like beta-hydroxyacid dehydrogenase
MTTKVGFVGLGVMGANMCRRILESGQYSLTVYDIDAQKVAELVALGAKAAPSLKVLAAEHDLIAASLPNPAIVRDVFIGAEGISCAVQPGCLMLDFSTVDSETSKAVAAQMAEKGATYVDTPVSGGKFDALKGTMTLIIGAQEAELSRAMPLLELLGNSIHFAGARGAGSTIKLVNNVMSMGNMLVAAEAFVLGVKAGVDGGTLFNILQHCGGRSLRLTKRFPSVLQGDFAPRFTVDLAEKDLTLALDLAHQLKVPMLMASVAHDFYLLTSKSGRGGLDATAVVQYLEELTGVLVRGEAVVDKKYV